MKRPAADAAGCGGSGVRKLPHGFAPGDYLPVPVARFQANILSVDSTHGEFLRRLSLEWWPKKPLSLGQKNFNVVATCGSPHVYT